MKKSFRKSITLREIRQLKATFQQALQDGKCFEEVKGIYLRIKELTNSKLPMAKKVMK